MAELVTGIELGDKLADAGLVPKNTRRILIDIRMDSCVTIYYETFASKKTIDLTIEELIKNKKDLIIKNIV